MISTQYDYGNHMPKINVNRNRFFSELDGIKTLADLERILEYAKGELDDEDPDILRIELNDTNRPDLWSSAGLLRLLKQVQGASQRDYAFVSSAKKQCETAYTLKVDARLKNIRPYIAGFIVKGPRITEEILDELIQLQEKLGDNYGQKRRGLAIGLYRLGDIQFPIQYRAVDPKQTRFHPLNGDREMNLYEILKEHPTGQKYAPLLKGFKQFPYLCDAQGMTLSFPPVINSNTIGKVELGDTELFVECTGENQEIVLLGASILACSFFDFGFSVTPVAVEYPYDTPHGKTIVTPYYFQNPIEVSVSYIEKLLGKQFSVDEVISALEMFDIATKKTNDTDRLIVHPPIYRNDFLHQADVAEEVMVAKGLSYFAPELPRDFTIGRLHPSELLSRKIRSVFVGLGYQEMLFNYLGSAAEFVELCYPEEEWNSIYDQLIEVTNPISANYAFIRPNPLSSFLRVESISSRAVYPHMQFEIGKRALRDANHPENTRTDTILGSFVCDSTADFNTIHRHIAGLLYYLDIDYQLTESSDSRFIPGRSAKICVKDKAIGIYGEIHPILLEKWSIGQPCVYAECVLDTLYEHKTDNT